MKIHIIVIASRGFIYDKLIKVYWIPLIKYITYRYSDKVSIELVFNRTTNLDDFKDISSNLVVCDCEETYIPGIIDKTMLAFRRFLKTDINFVLRTNLSSFWIIDKLLDVVESLPLTECYTGIVGKNGNDYFVSGAGMILSKDVVRYLVDAEKSIDKYKENDDVVFGQVLTPVFKPLVSSRYDITDQYQLTDAEIYQHYTKIINGNYHHIRIKNIDRSLDIKIFEFLTAIFGYSTEIYGQND
jgi:hypothetical protein